MEKKHTVRLDLVKGEAIKVNLNRQERVMMITPEAFVAMMKVLGAVFGTAGSTMRFLMGEKKGRHDVSEKMNDLKAQEIVFTNNQIIESILYQNRIAGWGAPELHEYNEKERRIIIRVKNNPLATAWGKAEEPMCLYLKGYWKGVTSQILEKEARCTETKCMCKGDPYCEFLIETET